ncbi:hypothetical protein CERSUDRAFT_118234 [Gelatoporia subvermispora B]|uniref:Uncharacterized protein n=1 Tax=Ceriporiopsis subvermispora (strain B) TaxID=914234 RepID=M2PC05_CERS8|nr:hypothetical protein CERSUDRAFT_118234 [Gelatoporia subvermispora B]
MQEFDLIPDPNTQLLRAKVAADRLWWRMICDRTSDPVLAAYIARAISYDRPEPRATGPTHQSRPLPPIPIQPIAQPRRVHVGDEAHVARQKPVERRGLRWGDGITAMDLLRSLEEGVPCDFKPRSVETAVPEPSNAHIEAERARTLLQMLMTPPEPQAGVPIHRGRFASQRNARGRGDDYHAAYYAPLAAH